MQTTQKLRRGGNGIPESTDLRVAAPSTFRRFPAPFEVLGAVPYNLSALSHFCTGTGAQYFADKNRKIEIITRTIDQLCFPQTELIMFCPDTINYVLPEHSQLCSART